MPFNQRWGNGRRRRGREPVFGSFTHQSLTVVGSEKRGGHGPAGLGQPQPVAVAVDVAVDVGFVVLRLDCSRFGR